AWSVWGYLAGNGELPGYQQMYDDGNSDLYNSINGWQIYSGANQSKNGVYGKHVTGQSPLVPYQGKLFALKGNALIAFSPNGSNPSPPRPLATALDAQGVASPITTGIVSQRLTAEVQKMLAAGPLRPGYNSAGQYQQYGEGHYTDAREMGEIF